MISLYWPTQIQETISSTTWMCIRAKFYNAFVEREAWKLPTMQKAVVNAFLSCGLANDKDGMSKLYMENHYSSPLLFVLLQEKYSMLACDTICSNRKGWDSKAMK